MAGPFILAIDQGTTSSRALVVDRAGHIAGLGQVSFTQRYPRPGWVEHDPAEIWSSAREAVGEALSAAGLRPGDITAIGIANQRETLVVWDRATSEPIGNAIVWQDRRTAAICEELRTAGHEDLIAVRTGLTLDPYFTGTKLTWLLRDRTELRARAERGELAAGTVDSWLIWKLTAGRRHVTDYTNASRTLLFNIRRGIWDDTLAGLLGVPIEMLPSQLPSRAHFGSTDADTFGAEVPITGVAGDQQAAFFGQACTAPGQAKNTYGTGAFLLAQAGTGAVVSRNRLLTSIGPAATAEQPAYVLEGSVFIAGAVVQWLRDELRLVQESSEIEALAASVEDTSGVTFVPAFAGLGAPYWDPEARGTLLGLTRGTTPAHIARAALEAIALSSVDLLEAMNSDLATPVAELRVDGGAARNDLLMQMQADFAGIPVIRPAVTETTSLGAAYLAGIQAGVWADEAEIGSLWRAERTFEPRMSAPERLQRLASWRRAVERTRGWAAGS